MYSFRKSNKGFTLIELMVVVIIIGVLVLLGLRAYSSQKERAMNSIVKANAATIQTMLTGYMGDHDITIANQANSIPEALGGVAAETGHPLESMVNPYLDTAGVYHIDSVTSGFDADPADPDNLSTTDITNLRGHVSIMVTENNVLLVNARGKYGELIMTPIIHSLPANKY